MMHMTPGIRAFKRRSFWSHSHSRQGAMLAMLAMLGLGLGTTATTTTATSQGSARRKNIQKLKILEVTNFEIRDDRYVATSQLFRQWFGHLHWFTEWHYETRLDPQRPCFRHHFPRAQNSMYYSVLKPSQAAQAAVGGEVLTSVSHTTEMNQTIWGFWRLRSEDDSDTLW